VSSRWFLGRALCDAWTTFDLICCTSSILHLLAISLDRYWAVTRLDYIHHRSTRRIVAMIGASWGGSIVISAPPLFISDPPNSDSDITGQCIINQNLAYTVFSTVGAFYLPFALMMIVYVKVFRAARARIRRKRFRPQPALETAGLTHVSPEHSRVSTHPPSVSNGDVEADRLEMEVQAAACPETDQHLDKVYGVGKVSVRVSKASVESLSSTSSEEASRDFPDGENAVVCGDVRARNLSLAGGQVSSDIEALMESSPHPRSRSCRSESDVVDGRRWMAKDDDRTVLRRSEKRPQTLAIDCKDECPLSSISVTNPTLTSQHQHHLDDVFEVSSKPEENHTAGSDHRRQNARPAEVETAGRVDRVVVAAVCTATSPSVEQGGPRPVNCDNHFYVEDPTSGGQHLCLPRKAADRLLTPASTPIHRSSWADLTRTLLPSAAALRLHFHGPSVAGRAAGRTARQLLEQRRERKAARTLAVITGTFVLCWLPFFIIAILKPFCGDHCHYPAPLISVIVWLGYVNSMLNPVIYTVFNADFRSAFRKILFGKYRSRRRQNHGRI